MSAGTGLTTADRRSLNLALSRHPAGKRHIRNTLATVIPIRPVPSAATANDADTEKEN